VGLRSSLSGSAESMRRTGTITETSSGRYEFLLGLGLGLAVPVLSLAGAVDVMVGARVGGLHTVG
jgi:hypothetical protein